MLRPLSISRMRVEYLKKHLKHYPHFDAPIPIKEIESLVNSPHRVAMHAFYPFLRYNLEWQPFRPTDAARPEKKSRPIRYAARGDAYVFTQYRRILGTLYEERLTELGIQQCPIAYRRISKPGSRGNKSSVDFAKDAFDEIDRFGNCVAVALDIEGFFENLDHAHIKRTWRDLLGEEELPPDHHAVFKNVTKYRYVDQREVYRRLGYFGTVTRDGRTIEGFTRPQSEIPKQLCSPREFRAKICGNDPQYSSLIMKNDERFGIPQGAPISDLIANFYLLDFDRKVHLYACQLGGQYMRYSDDILLLLPSGTDMVEEAVGFVADEIRRHGSRLRIKESKTCAIQFKRKGEELTCEHIKQKPNETEKNGLEYLGFRFDGKKVYVRESTMSRFYRKVSSAAKQAATKHVETNQDMSFSQLKSSFNYSAFSTRFLKVRREKLEGGPKNWTFYSYLKRAEKTFGARGDRIIRQTRRFRNTVSVRIEEAIERALRRHRRSGAQTK